MLVALQQKVPDTIDLSGQTALEVESPSFAGVLHDNLSNKKRQGSGLTPLGEKYLGFKGNAFSSQDATGCRNTMALD
ncbi:MAG: hypothetical protein ACR2OA_10420 [Rubripirellula sp.]